MSIPYDYSRCHPKWPYPCCKTCARHVENNEDFPRNRPMTVSDFSTDTKGDQLQECGMYIEDRRAER